MSDFHVVLMAGKKRTGKNTFATEAMRVLDNAGWHTYQMAFADELRRELAILNPFVGLNPYTHRQTRWRDAIHQRGSYEEAKEKYEEMRRLQQIYGTEVRRAADPDCWVRPVVAKIQQIRENRQPAQRVAVFITDCRFSNEFEHVVFHCAGTKRWLINTNRPLETNDNHASEDLRWVEQVERLDGFDRHKFAKINAQSVEEVQAAAQKWAGEL